MVMNVVGIKQSKNFTNNKEEERNDWPTDLVEILKRFKPPVDFKLMQFVYNIDNNITLTLLNNSIS